MAKTKKPRKRRSDLGKKRGKRIKNPRFQIGSIDFKTIGTSQTIGPNLTRLAGLVSSSRAVIPYQPQVDLASMIQNEFKKLKEIQEHQLVIDERQSVPVGQEDENDYEEERRKAIDEATSARILNLRRQEEEANMRAIEAETRAQGAEGELRQISSMVGELEAVGNTLEIRNQTLQQEQQALKHQQEQQRIQSIFDKVNSMSVATLRTITRETTGDITDLRAAALGMEGITKFSMKKQGKKMIFIPEFGELIPERGEVEQGQEEGGMARQYDSPVSPRHPLDQAIASPKRTVVQPEPEMFEMPPSSPRHRGRVKAYEESGEQISVNDVLQQKLVQQMRLKQVADFQHAMERGQEETLSSIAYKNKVARLEAKIERQDEELLQLVDPIERVVRDLEESRRYNRELESMMSRQSSTHVETMTEPMEKTPTMDLQHRRAFTLVEGPSINMTSEPKEVRSMETMTEKKTLPSYNLVYGPSLDINIPQKYSINDLMDERGASEIPARRIPTVDEVRELGLGATIREKKAERERRESLSRARQAFEAEQAPERRASESMTSEQFEKLMKENERENYLTKLREEKATAIRRASMPSIVESRPEPPKRPSSLKILQEELILPYEKEDSLFDEDWSLSKISSTPLTEFQRAQEDWKPAYEPFQAELQASEQPSKKSPYELQKEMREQRAYRPPGARNEPPRRKKSLKEQAVEMAMSAGRAIGSPRLSSMIPSRLGLPRSNEANAIEYVSKESSDSKKKKPPPRRNSTYRRASPERTNSLATAMMGYDVGRPETPSPDREFSGLSEFRTLGPETPSNERWKFTLPTWKRETERDRAIEALMDFQGGNLSEQWN